MWMIYGWCIAYPALKCSMLQIQMFCNTLNTGVSFTYTRPFPFFKYLLCSPRLHLFDQKYSKNKNIMKNCYNLKYLFSICIYFKITFIPVIAKLNFQQPVFKSSWSHDPSEIILICLFAAHDFFFFLISMLTTVMVTLFSGLFLS